MLLLLPNCPWQSTCLDLEWRDRGGSQAACLQVSSGNTGALPWSLPPLWEPPSLQLRPICSSCPPPPCVCLPPLSPFSVIPPPCCCMRSSSTSLSLLGHIFSLGVTLATHLVPRPLAHAHSLKATNIYRLHTPLDHETGTMTGKC